MSLRSADQALNDYANLRFGFRIEDLPTIKGERKLSNRLLSMYGVGNVYTIKKQSDIKDFINNVALPLFKLGPKEMFFGPRSGTVFTSSSQNLNMRSSDPLWIEFVSKIKELENTAEFGKPIPGVESKDIWSLTSFYNKL